mgnify:CR=1 FL=1
MAAALSVAAASVSCKKDKDDDTVTSDSFSGTLAVSGVPAFVLKGDTVKALPSGLESESVDIGYYWTASPLVPERDTVRHLGDSETNKGEFSLKIKDTLCTVTFSCTAFATGYYSQTATAYCTIVDPDFGGTISGDGVNADMQSVTDARDGKVYYYKSIGELDWFVRNLAYKGGDAGESYRGCEAMDGIFGRYYTRNEAAEACPSGWRLPSDDDWKNLAAEAGYAGGKSSVYPGIAGNLMTDAYFNGEKMWEYWPAVKITNSTGFSAIPSGYGIKGASSTFHGGFENAVYWSSLLYSDSDDSETLAVSWLINVNKPDLVSNVVSVDSFLAPVRCVRNNN